MATPPPTPPSNKDDLDLKPDAAGKNSGKGQPAGKPGDAKNARKPGEDPDLQGALEGGQAEPIPDEEEEQKPPFDFWRQPWVQNILPLATSLAFHIALIIIGYATYKTVQKVVSVVKEQIIIPEAAISDNPGGIPHPGLNGDPTRDAMQNIEKNVPADSQGWATKASDNLNQAAAGAAGDTEASVIGVGAGTAMGSKGGMGLSGGGDGSGALAPFGVPGGGGGGLGPKSNFLGMGGNAHKILYLCDASGSMVTVFGQLKVELKKSIEGLKPVQSFNVVFFSDADVMALNKEGLIMATPDNKQKAYAFIDDAVAHGGTQPIPAITFAMNERPELTYVLTDGFDQIANFDDVTNAFAKGNADKKMKVNCIFLQADEDPKLVQVLKKIAHDNGGLMKTILKTDF